MELIFYQHAESGKNPVRPAPAAWGRLMRLCILLLTTVFSAISHAESSSVSIVYAGEKPYVRKVINTLYAQLEKTPTTINTINIKQESLSRSPASRSSLIISLGTRATQQTLLLNTETPVLSLLIPSQSYAGLKKKHHKNTPWKAIFIDQPLQRQIIFIQALFGKHKKLGSILGPYSSQLKQQLEKAAKDHQQHVHINTIQSEKQLISTLKKLVYENDILIAIPDPVTFNKKTIRSILLLSYRQGVPIIGFSQSYVTAGAIAAIFTTPEQVSAQAANIIEDYIDTKKFTSETLYSNDYSIAINKNVARTLGIHLPGKSQIYRKMERLAQ